VGFREVSVVEVREVLRGWLEGHGLRRVAERAGVDRKTARRYVSAAQAEGLCRDAGVAALTDELVGAVVGAVRPARPNGHGPSWETLLGREEQITAWVTGGAGQDPLSIVKIAELLARQGCVVPYRTLHRFAVAQCGFRVTSTTMRVNDGEPGVECQIDFAQMGVILDPPKPGCSPGVRAGMRIHGTTGRPAEAFTAVEASCLLPVPPPYDLPTFTRVKVHRDFHFEVCGSSAFLARLLREWCGLWWVPLAAQGSGVGRSSRSAYTSADVMVFRRDPRSSSLKDGSTSSPRRRRRWRLWSMRSGACPPRRPPQTLPSLPGSRPQRVPRGLRVTDLPRHATPRSQPRN